MQMPEDDGPVAKRSKLQAQTDSSSEFDLSALNDLPDSLLTSNTDSGNTNQSFISGLLASSTANNVITQQPTVQQSNSQHMQHQQQIVNQQMNSQQIVNPSVAQGTTSLLSNNIVYHSTTPTSGTPVLSSRQPQQGQMVRPAPLTTSTANGHSMANMQGLPNQALMVSTMNGVHQRPQGQPLISAVRPQVQPSAAQRANMGGNVRSTAGSALLSTDPDKRHMITQQLVLLLHAHKCKRRNKEGPNDTGSDVCMLQYCGIMKKALAHMPKCQLGNACRESHCVSSRQIISHWKSCVNPSCSVCYPLKNVTRKGKTANANRDTSDGVVDTGNGRIGTAGAVIGNHSLLNRQVLNSNEPQQATFQQLITNQPVSQQLTNQQSISRQLPIGQQGASQLQQRSALQTQLTSPVSNHISANISSQPMSQQQQQRVVARPLGNATQGAMGNVVRQQVLSASNRMQNPSPPIDVEEMKRAYSALGLKYNPNVTPPSAQINLPLPRQDTASPQTPVPKQWHNTINPNIRNVLINKLVQAIFPAPDPRVVNDPRMNNLLSYARKVENDMFCSSDSLNEYYQKLAEKIYKIRRELEEKRKQRQLQVQQSQAAKALLDPKHDPMLVDTSGQVAKAMLDPKIDPMMVDTKPNLKTEIKSEPVAYNGLSSPSLRGDASGTQAFSSTKNLLQKPKSEPSVPDNKASIQTPSPSASTPTTAAAPAAPPVYKKVVPKKVWKKDELKTALMPLVLKMIAQEEAVPFHQPVDPVVLNIPDYFDIIKKPMDLSTIQRKLEKGLYQNPWEYTNDVWQMFDNAWLYNKKTSKVYKWCTKLSEVFEGEIDVIMTKLGFCCGRKYVYYPNVLVCYGKQTCTIAQYQVYYAYDNRYTYCDKCFAEISTASVELTDELTGNPLILGKSQFIKTKNDVLDPEPMTSCKDCEREFHSVCVQHMNEIWENGYLCDACLQARNQKRKENRYAAKRLPTCKLSTHIEQRVNSYLERKGILSSGEVTIRILSFTEKETEVKQGMKEKFPEMAAMIPYRCKALFAFQSCPQKRRDICFFSMHVQEYDSNAPAPNTSRVYISYLDSVHFFTPREYRTAVYHEILIGYFDYVRVLGFNWGHIWACPPSEGDDYIFHAHPAEQKVPKPKRLQEWYKKMLDKAIIEGVVSDYKDIYKDAVEKNMSSASELPYFEGDFWTTILEDCVKECQEEEAKRLQEEAEEVDDVTADDGAAGSLDSPLGLEGSSESPTSIVAIAQANKQKKLKGNSKAKHLKKNVNKKQIVGSDLSSKLFSNIEKHKDMFFVIRLKNRPYNSPGAPANTSDPDPILSSELMDARDNFLTMCREKHWEFSSLRRATFSTMAFLYEIHTTNRDGGFVYTCNACKAQVETRYHCTQCEDFDLCVPCHAKQGHEHKMEKLGLGLTEGTDQGDSKLSPAETRKRSLQRCIDSLVHASQCRDANCKLAVCEKMKRVVSHTKMCKRKTTGGCPICKQLITLCCYHAKICREAMCPVPFCTNIKNKFKQQQHVQRLHQARLLQRRMANMNHVSSATAGSSAANRGSALARQLAANTARPASLPVSASGSLQRVVTSTPTPSSSLVSQQSVSYTISPQQQRVVQQKQQQHRAVAGSQSLLQNVVGQPQNQSQQLQQLQRQQQQQQMLNDTLSQPIVLSQGTQNVQVVRPLQRPQQAQTLQHQAGQSHPSSSSASTPSTEQSRLLAKQKLQRLLTSLSSGHSQTAQEKQQLVALLKSHPPLLQTFLKQQKLLKLAKQQKQQQQQQQGGMPGGSLVQQQLLSTGAQSTSLMSTGQPQVQQLGVHNPSQLQVPGMSGLQANNVTNMGLGEETSSATDQLTRYADSL